MADEKQERPKVKRLTEMTLDDHERQIAFVQEGKDLTGREDRDADQRTQ